MSGAETREEIVAVSTRLFEQRGIGATTMRAIAAECGIRAASLYHHFASKDEIVAAVLQRSTDYSTERHATIDRGPISSREHIAALARATLDSLHAHPEASRLFAENADYVAASALLRPARASARAITARWIEALAAARTAGVLRVDAEPAALWDLIRSMLLAASRSAGPDQADLVVDLVLGGLLGSTEPAVTGAAKVRAAASRGARPSPIRRDPSAP